jgi:SpoVK/Ycf46/Vps4 family AAA+-type ATPase
VELVDAIDPQRGLGEIVLSHEARGLVDRVLEEHHRAEELRRHSLPLRSKLLLCGPPGCGKTLCAEVIARELSLPLYVTKLDVIISSFLGETSTNLRRLFDFASRRASVLFLDEFDALARARNDASEHNELRRVVNSLLIFIDRFKGRGLLIAASNLESALDSAVWRRFDEVITLDPPGPTQIEQLLQLEFRNFPVNFDLASQVSKLAGLSYAEIERVCVDSIKSAVLKRRKGVSETEFAAAVRQEQRRKIHPRPRQRAAFPVMFYSCPIIFHWCASTALSLAASRLHP